jgi:hypothetical protein
MHGADLDLCVLQEATPWLCIWAQDCDSERFAFLIIVRTAMDSITPTGQALKLVAVITALAVFMPAQAASPSETVTVSGLSGERGLEAHVAEPDGTTHAIYGITSAEISDDPCLVTVRKVHISNRASKADFPRDWCGSKRAGSSLLSVQGADGDAHFTSDRVFVTGVRDCMNSLGDNRRIHWAALFGTLQLAWECAS